MTNEERYQGISLFRPEPQNRPMSARTGRVEELAGLVKKARRGPDVAATRQTTGRTHNGSRMEVHEEDLKVMEGQ